MSIVFAFVLIAIAWFLSALIDSMANFWHLLGIVPLWLVGAIVVGLLAWFVRDP